MLNAGVRTYIHMCKKGKQLAYDFTWGYSITTYVGYYEIYATLQTFFVTYFLCVLTLL